MVYDEREDTDPGTLGALGPFRALTGTTRALGRYRRLFVPLGVLSVIGLGVHAAAGQFAEWMFHLLDLADKLVEGVHGALADLAMTDPEARKLGFASLFGLAEKQTAAQWAALGMELLIDLRLGFGALAAFERDELGYVLPGSKLHHRLWAVFGRRLHRLKQVGAHTARYLRQPSVEKIYLPLAVAIAATAGCLVLFVAVDNAFFALGRNLPAGWNALDWATPWPAAVASAVVFWRLGLPAVLGAFARCERVVQRDVDNGEPFLRRTLRGLWGAALILPILAAGLWIGTPLGAWFRQILGAGGP